MPPLTDDIDGLDFTGRIGSSSSERVRSITSLWGRLRDVEPPIMGVDDAARELIDGVRMLEGVGVNVLGCICVLKGTELSLISIKSSSSSSDGVGFDGLLARLMVPLLSVSCPCACHRPSGSIVTCSVSFEVLARISLT